MRTRLQENPNKYKERKVKQATHEHNETLH